MDRTKMLGSVGLLCAAVAVGATLTAADARAGGNKGGNKVEGAVAEVSGTCPSVRFKVGAQVVATNESTKFDDGTCANVQNGRRVEVEGALQGDGTLLATEVDFD